MKKVYILLFFVLFANSLFASAPISVHKDWTLFKTKVDNKDICYVASLPIKKEGTYKKRGEPYVMIMREKGKNFDEVSVSSGFLYNQDKDIEITILKRKFPLFANDEKAWTYDKNDDIEIVKQMQNGAKMYVLGYSKGNSKAYDTYSLFGFTEAYKKMLELCK